MISYYILIARNPIFVFGSDVRFLFRDLGFSEEKSAELILKSSLLQALQDTIRSRAWKQVETAARLGIDQAKVSKLLAGQMAGFSVERLVHFLSLLGLSFEPEA